MDHHKSHELFDRLCEVMPGANTRTVSHYEPFPISIVRGQGCRVWDADGNCYLDFINNYAPLVHGHAAPPIVEAITQEAALGTVFPTPTALQAELAERICSRFPSIDQVRFCNSGTEAVMMAVRAARAFTGRDELIMPSGGYHGSWEQVSVEWETGPNAGAGKSGGGASLAPPGIPAQVVDLIHLVRYNDIADLEALMARHGSRVAAIILEPVLGHVCEPADPEFIRAALALAHDHGALLILDEVITSRLNVAGWQGPNDVEPDLTTLGKIIGGGLPIGAFGGRKDIMEIFDPRREHCVAHHGTFNGNSLAMAAGCASLDMLDQAEIDRINGLGEQLAAQMAEAAADAGVDLRVANVGSLLHLHTPMMPAVFRACLAEGLFIAPRGSINLSTAMDEAVIQEAVAAWRRALESVVAAEVAGCADDTDVGVASALES
jgi:glutamate-1-semialdehyde 2,1-aminomutase